MSRMQATVFAVVAALAGLGLLGYVLAVVSPYDETGQLSGLALLLFFAGLFLVAGGLATLLALAAHQRWPALAGRGAQTRAAPGRAGKARAVPATEAALRQGILAGLVVAVLLALSILRVLDVTFLLVTLLLAGLVEAYAQTRR